MEVCQSKFRSNLLDLLEQISNASFITFDLEMSGISVNPKHDRSHDVGKPNLQQQYEEIKGAADTFQLLQLGLTLVEEERQRDFYLARPYNFYLSPLSVGGVDIGIQRTICFSSSACDFLSKNRFDFGKVFGEGVSYLSREEEAELRLENSQRLAKLSSIPDIEIQSENTKAQEFYNDSCKIISDWIKKPEQDYVNIGAEMEKLSGFQRRLVHQLVRKEFPGYRTYSRSDGDFMQVTKINPSKEARVSPETSSIYWKLIHKFRADKLKKFDAQIVKQKGLSWVFEALCGGDLSGIDPLWLYIPNDSEPENGPASISLRLKNLNAKLKAKDHVIVGHNILMDLAFLYKTFVGSLPLHVEDFLDEIHQLFPKIIDTKFMATHNLEFTPSRSGLSELLEPLKKIQNPIILLHEDHRPPSYNHGKQHEAGFDSWMTAELFIKLSAKLSTDRKNLTNVDKTSSAIDTNKISINHSSNQNLGNHSGTKLAESEMSFISNSEAQQMFSSPKVAKKFVSKNPYAALEMNEPEEQEVFIEANTWLPNFEDEFWKVYFNKLRVNSIESCVCDLDRRDASTDDNLTRKKPRLN